MAFGATGCIPDVISASDPVTLQQKILDSFAAQLTASPVSQLVEIQLVGAGAGGLWQMTLIYSTTEAGNWPNLADQNVRVFGAPDRATMKTKLVDFYDDTPVDRTTFVEKGAAGAGAYFVDVIVYTLDEEAFNALMVDADEVEAKERPVIPAPAEPTHEALDAELRRRERVRKRAEPVRRRRSRE